MFSNNAAVGFFDPATGAYSSVSDRKVKTNIRSMNSILSKVGELMPSQYEYIHNNPDKKGDWPESKSY